MAKKLSKQDILTRKVVRPGQVSQSIDAFTGLEAYDITISGSLTLTGSLAINGLNTSSQTNVLTIDSTTGQLYYTASNAIGTTIDTGSFVSTSSFNNFTGSYNTGSFTGSFVGDGSQLTGTPNFANTDLIFNANRNHDINGNYLFIYNSLGNNATGPYIYLNQDQYTSIGYGGGNYADYIDIGNTPAERGISFHSSGSQKMFLGNSGSRYTNNLHSFTGSVNISGSVFLETLTNTAQSNVVTINSSTGQLYYTASSAIGGTIDTGSFVSTSSFNNLTSSFNNFTGSFNTGSFSGSFTGSLQGTASYATNALSASYVPGIQGSSQYIAKWSGTSPATSNILQNSSLFQDTSGNLMIGLSGTTTAKLDIFQPSPGRGVQISTLGTSNVSSLSIQNDGPGNFLTFSSGSTNIFRLTTSGNARLTGSLSVTGSAFIQGLTNTAQSNVVTIDSSTGQLYYTASSAIGGGGTPAPSDTFIQYNSGSTFGATGSFRFIHTSESLEQGFTVNAFGNYSHAEGIYSQAIGNYSHAEGSSNNSVGSASHAEGSSNQANADFSHAEGVATNTGIFGSPTIGLGSHTEGTGTSTLGNYSHAEGDYTIAIGISSHTEGQATTSSGDYSHAEGYKSISSGSYSHAEGGVPGIGFNDRPGGLAIGTGSHAEGAGTQAIGNGSHAEGKDTIASGSYSHAEGTGTQAIGFASHAEGINNRAWGLYSHVEGNANDAFGTYSHAEGGGTQTSGSYSHAEGGNTTTLGEYSHAEGKYTLALGTGSHAEGYFTTSSGNYSHAKGSGSISVGISSHAEGNNTVAVSNYQHTQGTFNLVVSGAGAFIHGNGTSNADRRNLLYASGSQFQITGSVRVTGSIDVTDYTYSNTMFTERITTNQLITISPTNPLPSVINGSIAFSSSGDFYFGSGSVWNKLTL